MPISITIEMNITENSERCPMTRVATPIDQQRLAARTRSISRGLPTLRNATSRRPSVSANAMMVARWLSRNAATIRSEEHTSELQSLTNLVCRLLLEKKKKKKKTQMNLKLTTNTTAQTTMLDA